MRTQDNQYISNHGSDLALYKYNLHSAIGLENRNPTVCGKYIVFISL